MRVSVCRDLRREGGQSNERGTSHDDPLALFDVAGDLDQTRLAISQGDGASLEALAGHLDEDDRLSRIVDDGTVGYGHRLCGR